jgi:hypothetical protein
MFTLRDFCGEDRQKFEFLRFDWIWGCRSPIAFYGFFLFPIQGNGWRRFWASESWPQFL